MSALEQLAGWPVPHAAAAVVGPSGLLATTGDVHRRFRLASVTKPLTALATLVAVEEEAIALDAPLTECPALDPAVSPALPGATLAHLLAHASGLGPDRRERAAQPGTRRIYSNAGYDVIGEWVTAATGIAFDRYLSEAVFAPLRMAGASLQGSPAKDGWASVTDLVALLGELLTPTGLLHPSTVAAATTPAFGRLTGVLPGYGRQEDNSWGLGFEVRDGKHPHWTAPANSSATFGHFGRSGTFVWVDPVARLACVVLTDRDFAEWAVPAWPAVSAAVLAEFSATG
jgi:CubicO group peptidase (beta-lactamase class C family)